MRKAMTEPEVMLWTRVYRDLAGVMDKIGLKVAEVERSRKA